VQRLGVGQYAGVLGIHVHRRPAQVNKTRFRVAGQYIRLLAVIDGDGKKIALAIGAEQGGGLNGIRLGEFTGFEVDGNLAVVGVSEQAAITPQGHEPGRAGIQGTVYPFLIVTKFHQAIEPDRCKDVTPGTGYPVDAQILLCHQP